MDRSNQEIPRFFLRIMQRACAYVIIAALVFGALLTLQISSRYSADGSYKALLDPREKENSTLNLLDKRRDFFKQNAAHEQKKTSTDREFEEKLQNSSNAMDASQCVPHHKDLMAISKPGNGKWNAGSMQLIAAYEYKEYLVVTFYSGGGGNGKQVFCRYLSQSFHEIGTPVRSSIVPETAVHCCRRSGAFYMAVTEQEDEPIKQWVPVLDRTQEAVYQMALCLAPMFGNDSQWLLLAETIEHYKLQGVDHFYLYVKDIDDYSRKLVTSYVSSGEAEVVFLDYRQDYPGEQFQKNEITDCLHRARNHSRYAIFADIDERITPSTNVSLLDFALETFSNDSNIASMQFRPRWILRTARVPSQYNDASTVDSHLPTKIFHNTSSWPGPGHTSKCIVDPNKVMVMSIHYVSNYMPGDYKTINVDPNTAIIRHYRDLAAGAWGTRWLPEVVSFGPFQNTDYPKHQIKKLIDSVKSRLHRVYASNIIDV